MPKLPEPWERGAVSVRVFAERLGISEDLAASYCRKGLVRGARRDAMTSKWWVYPPATLILDGSAPVQA